MSDLEERILLWAVLIAIILITTVTLIGLVSYFFIG